MLTLTKVINSVEYSENENSFIITSFTLSERVFNFLSKIQTVLSNYDLGVLDVMTEYGDTVLLTDPFEAINGGVHCRLSINKSKQNTFFSPSALVRSLKSQNLLTSDYYIPFEAKGFASDLVLFAGREEIVAGVQKIVIDRQLEASNSKLIKSLNDESINFVPLNIKQWICSGIMDYPDYWKQVAGPKLLASTASELLLKNNVLEATFRGERRVSISIDLLDKELPNSVFEIANNICKWIYTEGKDIETRHNLFNNSVGNLSVYDVDHFFENFSKIAERILENSILAYRYYLSNSNKELNKSLIEINKTLFDHIGKIRQNTSDLVSSLWRDFTTAFGLLVLNFSLKKPDISGMYWNLILVGLILYLLISYYLSSSVGFWFYKRLKDSLTDMRSRIYGYLTDSDFETFALKPLKSAQGKFITTFWLVLFCYLAIIILVLCSIIFSKVTLSKSIFSFA